MALFATEFSPRQKVGYLKSLPSIRAQCSKVHALAQENKLKYFEYHPENEDKAVDFCVEIIKASSVATSQGYCDAHEKRSVTLERRTTPSVATCFRSVTLRNSERVSIES